MHWILWALLVLLATGAFLVLVLEIHLRRNFTTTSGASMGVARFCRMLADGKFSAIKPISTPVLPVVAKPDPPAQPAQQPNPRLTQRNVAAAPKPANPTYEYDLTVLAEPIRSVQVGYSDHQPSASAFASQYD